MKIINKRIINLLGRYKHVRDASVDIYDFYNNNNGIFKNRVINMHSQPHTVNYQLKNIFEWHKNPTINNPILIINRFPATSYSQLIDLNINIMKQSNYTFDILNLIVHNQKINDEFYKELLDKKVYYHDIFTLCENEYEKFEKINKYLLNIK